MAKTVSLFPFGEKNYHNALINLTTKGTAKELAKLDKIEVLGNFFCSSVVSLHQALSPH